MRILITVLLGLLSSLLEVISIGAVLPFLAALLAPEKLFENRTLSKVFDHFSITPESNINLIFTIIFIIAAVVSGVLRIFTQYQSTRTAFTIGLSISKQLYSITLFKPYDQHCNQNSSEIITILSRKIDQIIYGVFIPSFLFASSIILLSIVVITLLIIQPLITLQLFLIFFLIYFIIVLTVKKTLTRLGALVSATSEKSVRILQETFLSIRDIIINSHEKIYLKQYANNDHQLRNAQGYQVFIASTPKYIIETLGMVLIALTAFYFMQSPDVLVQVVPLLGATALAAQRLIPVTNHIFSAWSSLQTNSPVVDEILELLSQETTINDSNSKHIVTFENQIELKNVSYRYAANSQLVLNNINLVIPKGSTIVLVGKSGSGKSTLNDIIMGLLQPTQGQLLVDDMPITEANRGNYQRLISHVPQDINLIDETISSNVAFGVPSAELDDQKMREVCQVSMIDQLIEKFTEKYDTKVGERGSLLSGGQIQRIGIARCLYPKSSILCLDEATSALDKETEQAIISQIKHLGMTQIQIAHRQETIKNAEHHYQINAHGLQRIANR